MRNATTLIIGPRMNKAGKYIISIVSSLAVNSMTFLSINTIATPQNTSAAIAPTQHMMLNIMVSICFINRFVLIDFLDFSLQSYAFFLK